MDNEVKGPTCDELFNDEGVKSVLCEADASWRHGSYITEVFQREADGTFWEAFYRKSGDGETNELREGTASIRRVYPFETTVTRYAAQPKDSPAGV